MNGLSSEFVGASATPHYRSEWMYCISVVLTSIYQWQVSPPPDSLVCLLRIATLTYFRYLYLVTSC